MPRVRKRSGPRRLTERERSQQVRRNYQRDSKRRQKRQEDLVLLAGVKNENARLPFRLTPVYNEDSGQMARRKRRSLTGRRERKAALKSRKIRAEVKMMEKSREQHDLQEIFVAINDNIKAQCNCAVSDSFLEQTNPPDAVEYDENIVVKEEISINYDDPISPQRFPPFSPLDEHQFEDNLIVKEETLINDDSYSTLTLQNSSSLPSSEISMKYYALPTSTLEHSVSLSPSYEHEHQHKVNMKDAVSNIYDVILTPTPAAQDPVASRVTTPHSNHSLQVNQLSDQSISCLQDLKQKDDDECHLYGKLIAKKLRRVPELEREELMHEIDGLFLRAAQKRYLRGFGYNSTSSSTQTSLNSFV